MKKYIVEVQSTTAVLVNASSEEQAKRIALYQVRGQNKVAVTIHSAEATKAERIKHALSANGLTWHSPVVDLIDALVYDGDFTGQEADEIVTKRVAGVR